MALEQKDRIDAFMTGVFGFLCVAVVAVIIAAILSIAYSEGYTDAMLERNVECAEGAR